MPSFILRGFRRLFTKGPWDTVRWVRYHLCERYREWSLGIDTDEGADAAQRYADPKYVSYEALSYECIDSAFASLAIRRGEDVFLDYGCGKGRVLTVAATRPFRRVIGVEMLPDLAAVAERNLSTARRRLRCRETEVVVADASTYRVPPDVTVIFLFNPFRGEVLSAVQQQIHGSLTEHPRCLSLFYINPLEDEDTFATCDWLNAVRSLSTGMWPGMRFALYEANAAAFSRLVDQPDGNGAESRHVSSDSRQIPDGVESLVACAAGN